MYFMTNNNNLNTNIPARLIQNKLLEAIQNEIDLLIDFQQKYHMGFGINTRVANLNNLYELVACNKYWLEKVYLENSVRLIFYFPNQEILTTYLNYQDIIN